MKIQLPQKVSYIIETLAARGFEAYAVGGCVRDSILKRKPDDWDITTSALPYQVKQIFPRTVDTGIQHGTVTVLVEKEGFEVTTYRIDGEYEDKRHPKEVLFTENLIEDLKRRDFTINAMAYNEEKGLIDAFDGVGDLEKGIIRCVGKAQERFEEDALRVLRGIRFAAQLGFTVEEKTRQAMAQLAGNLANISAERIQIELVKLLVSPHPELLRTAYELGITRVILPEFDCMMPVKQENPHHKYTVGEHTLHALENIRSNKVLRLSVLFHDMGKPATHTVDEEGIGHFYGHAKESERIAGVVLRRLKFDNDTRKKVEKLVCWHDYRMMAVGGQIRKTVNKVGEELFFDLLEVMRADVLAQSSYLQKEKLEELEKIKMEYEAIRQKGDCLSIRQLAVNGNDLMKAGIKGRAIGEKLEWLLEKVLEEPSLNTREQLLEMLKQKK